MSVVICALGVLCVVVFAAAGYKTLTKMRSRKMTDEIAYQPRTEMMYQNLSKSLGWTPSSMIHRAIIAKSVTGRSFA